ncbi:MAG: hypothetical protein AB7K24_15015, partial [Gemmataceae bacterium]
MRTGAQRIRTALVLLLALANGTARGQLPPGPIVPVAVKKGHAEVVLPTAQPGDKYYLILGSLSTDAGPHRVRVTTEACAEVPTLVESSASAGHVSKNLRRRQIERLQRARQRHDLEQPVAAKRAPAAQRTFHLFVKRTEFDDPDSYVAVRADLKGHGEHCQVYVDKDVAYSARLQAAVDDVVRTFDQDVYPSSRELGQALDVDRDGRFTILFSGWLDRLCDGTVAIGGFVRGSDFYRDLPAPLGNRCDMMFLNASLETGPHLRTLLAHEYTHAIVFTEHVFGGYLPEETPREEEGWLNEALAHVVEARHGYGWSNLDYRVSAFLNDPARYQLVVPDYYHSGLWRSHGNRGATFLFLHWCQRRAGPDLLNKLARSSLSGIANLEAALDEDFATLFRGWTTSLVLDDSLCCGELGDRRLCGPRFATMNLARDRRDIEVNGTSAAYLLLHSPSQSAARIEIEAEESAQLQVSLVRVPAATARLEVKQQRDKAGRLVLSLTAHDADVLLEGLIWERAVPAARRSEDTGKISLRDCFSCELLRAGETRTSKPLSWPGLKEHSWVIKV